MIKFINLLRESFEGDEVNEYDYFFKKNDLITPETIKKIKSTDRIVVGTEDKLDLSRSISSQKIGMKPKGLWYGFGTSWIDFIRSEMPDRETQHVFKIEIETNSEDIIHVDTEKIFLWFSKRYKDPEKDGSDSQINWPEISKKYKGIEFPEYFDKFSRDYDHFWYIPWDIASGCIWDTSIIKNVIKLQ